MMRRIALTAALVFANLGCSDDLGVGGDNAGGDFDITVGAGTQPMYSWQGALAVSVEVARTAEPLVPVWMISSPSLQNIASPVTHGTVPADAIEVFDSETTLTAGVQYRVRIVLSDGDEAFRVFRP